MNHLGRGVLRWTAASVAAAALVATMSGCGGNDPDPLPPVTSSTALSPSADPSEVAYKGALARWTEYEQTSEPIWAAGKHTAEATQLFKSYWERWQIPDRRLRQYAASDIQSKGTPKVLSSRPKSSTPERVVIQQCVDYSTVTVTQDGKATPLTAKRSQRRFITLTRKASTAQWLVFALDDATSKARACAA